MKTIPAPANSSLILMAKPQPIGGTAQISARTRRGENGTRKLCRAPAEQ
jgi:hypothetical protein